MKRKIFTLVLLVAGAGFPALAAQIDSRKAQQDRDVQAQVAKVGSPGTELEFAL